MRVYAIPRGLEHMVWSVRRVELHFDRVVRSGRALMRPGRGKLIGRRLANPNRMYAS